MRVGTGVRESQRGLLVMHAERAAWLEQGNRAQFYLFAAVAPEAEGAMIFAESAIARQATTMRPSASDRLVASATKPITGGPTTNPE